MEGLPAKRDVRREQPGRSEALGVAVTQAGRRWPGPCARSREAWRGSGVRSATAPCRSQTKRGASSGSQQYSSRKKGKRRLSGSELRDAALRRGRDQGPRCQAPWVHVAFAGTTPAPVARAALPVEGPRLWDRFKKIIVIKVRGRKQMDKIRKMLPIVDAGP